MRRLLGMAVFAMMMAFGFAAVAEQTEFDPAKVSESLKAIFQFGSVDTKKALNANTVTVISGTIGGTYVQFGADLASVLDDGNRLRVLTIVGRGLRPRGVGQVLTSRFQREREILARRCGRCCSRNNPNG